MTNEKKHETKNSRKSLYLDLSFLGTLIFFLFRIPITNIIGNEGNGYFAFSWELYTVFGLIFGHCLSNIVSEMVHRRVRKNQYHNSSNVLATSLILGTILSLLGGIIIYIFSDILLGLVNLKLSGISFRLLGILLLFSSLSGIFRGYFEGLGTKVPTSFSKIIEGFIAGSGALIFTSVLSKYGTKVGALLYNPQYKPAYGATGVAAGCICGTLFALLFLFVINFIYQTPLKQLFKKDVSKETESVKNIFKELCKLFLITFMEIAFFNLFRIINMWLYVQTTLATDMKDKIVQYLGSYHGKVLVLTTILILVILIFTGRNLRKIPKYYHRNSLNHCWNLFCEDIKHILFIAIPCTLLLAVFAKNIFTIIYKSAGNIEVLMLQIGSVNIILIALAIYMYRILRKLDLKLFLFLIPLAAFVIQTITMSVIVKIPTVGALSMIITEVIFWALVVSMELLLCVKALKQGFKSKI